ncbi:MAG: 3-chlorobenzoate-3,4-dioxygenase [Solibacterales bacterium]|nr:3-chlorobenzoate-3,4-dioxygenase [Bryobacterales bacterium]|tara:strand:- start:28115 stop:29227 length:1113 start_codon:yes stop_codon:yes gene_type:complete
MATNIGKAKRRAAIIGHTGHGEYGHGLDTVWSVFDSVEVVAVADPDDQGRAEAQQRSGAKRAYRDYREMLTREKPDYVSVGPRWLDQRVEMVTAVAEAGAHIYLEKPFARSLKEADRMIAAIEKSNVKVQTAHQMRTSPYAIRVKELLEAGEIGTIQEVRLRGKEDRRAGGEDLIVLGTHLFDLSRMFFGDPHWVFAHVTHDGREISSGDIRNPTEPVGAVAGNQIAAMFAFDRGVHAYYGSKASDQKGSSRWGTRIFGSRGIIDLPNQTYPKGQPRILRTHRWMPTKRHKWEAIEGAPHADLPAKDRMLSNALMVQDLFEAVDQDRKPVTSAHDARWALEMIFAIYESQKSGSRVQLPLKQRAHPLESL